LQVTARTPATSATPTQSRKRPSPPRCAPRATPSSAPSPPARGARRRQLEIVVDDLGVIAGDLAIVARDLQDMDK
jgi:hypothetical protein